MRMSVPRGRLLLTSCRRAQVPVAIHRLLRGDSFGELHVKRCSEVYEVQLQVRQLLRDAGNSSEAIAARQADGLPHSAREFANLLRQKQHAVRRRLVVPAPPFRFPGVVALECRDGLSGVLMRGRQLNRLLRCLNDLDDRSKHGLGRSLA